jgi:hypothetical protein
LKSVIGVGERRSRRGVTLAEDVIERALFRQRSSALTDVSGKAWENIEGGEKIFPCAE